MCIRDQGQALRVQSQERDQESDGGGDNVCRLSYAHLLRQLPQQRCGQGQARHDALQTRQRHHCGWWYSVVQLLPLAGLLRDVPQGPRPSAGRTTTGHQGEADIMTVSRTTETAVAEEWLTVQDACALIGVSPATLRRWSAAGDVQAFTTPGGHRRFARSMILGLLPSARRERPTLEHLGETPEHMMGVYRRHLAQACGGLGWLAGLGEDELEPLRDHGRRIAMSLLVFMDASTPDERRTAIHKAEGSASEYGRIAARESGQIRETVEAFLRFRMLFLAELAQVARRRGLDTTESTNLLVTATQAIDQLLVALMSGHETELAEIASERDPS